MKIATFNVNGLRGRLPNLLEWLKREQPDIVCLQELKAAQDAFPDSAIAEKGYASLWHGERPWNGVAILARDLTITEIRKQLPGDDSDEHSRFLEATVGPLVVGCVYLPNGNPQPGPKFDYKLRWFDRLIDHAAKLFRSKKPVVIAGDFNVVPTDFDIYDPKSWRKDALLQPESRACWERLLLQGWVDAIRTQYPEEKVFTFWDYFRQHWQRHAGLRIDDLLLNQPAAKGLKAAGVDTWVRGEAHASDHAPAWIELASEALKASKSKRRAD